MIKVNKKEIKIEEFPDGTPRIKLDYHQYENTLVFVIEWCYETDAELLYVGMIKKHLEKYFSDSVYYLKLPYIPNARMDRTQNDDEVFTLKYFCDFINQLRFNRVYVTDAHSNVAAALLDRCYNKDPFSYIFDAIHRIGKVDVLYYPDAGAAKRYAGLFGNNIPYCYGEKKRDWNTGNIIGLEIKTNGIELNGKIVLMVDDIISYGGSLHYSAAELKKCGVGEIYAYATHVENSVLNEDKGTLINDLNDGTVLQLFTTDSIYKGDHPKITAIKI